ncbi:MAG TPA: hypothetical protein VGY94_03855, partial [Acidobacteriaceae bacterium]|nr:hypothetical protein [Acidobacteriaceae bacterium]
MASSSIIPEIYNDQTPSPDVDNPRPPDIISGRDSRIKTSAHFADVIAAGRFASSLAEGYSVNSVAVGMCALSEAVGQDAASVAVGSGAKAIVYGEGETAVGVGYGAEAHGVGERGVVVVVNTGCDCSIISGGPGALLVFVHTPSREVCVRTVGEDGIKPYTNYTIS